MRTRSYEWIVAAAMCLASSLVVAADSRPNFVIILADDMGFSDPGCYGGEIRTPHLDRLAAEGVRFSQFYNCALCGPSRAALMTGIEPHQAGILDWTGLLNERCVTVFELLKEAGYATCATGRLDMVTSEDWHDPAAIARHVDRFFGTTGHKGPGNYFKDVRNTDFFLEGKPYSIPEDGYKTDLVSDEPVHLTDLPATLLDLAGAPYPSRWRGRSLAPQAGRSLAPLWREGKREGHEFLCWTISGHRAIREGDWKLVAPKGSPWELYDLSVDRAERHNLAGAHPERVARMAAQHAAWQAR